MKKSIHHLEELIHDALDFIASASDKKLSIKPAPEKWSKKEILGHLIDSAINNLQRFTEIQFSGKPFSIKRYDQDELVKANVYQQADLNELFDLWLCLNERITTIMKAQTEDTLAFDIVLPDGEKSDLKFLMEDYVVHLEHHLKQVMG